MFWNTRDSRTDRRRWVKCVAGILPIVALAISLSSCATPPLPYRIAGDYQTQVVYLSATIAMSRHLSVFEKDTQAFFTLGRAHWEKPEQASDTGDRFDERVRGTIVKVGRSTDGRWLLAESEDYDWEKHQPISYVTAIWLESGVMHSATNRAALQKEVAGFENVETAKLEPAEFFFERELLSRIKP